jgi:hypothetical protein
MLERDDVRAPLMRRLAGFDGRTGAAPGPAPRPLYPISRLHLTAMTDHLGLWQHARGAEPDPRFGYCTDDVARSLVVDGLHARQGLWSAVEASVSRSLEFLGDAYDRASGRFLNFRRADGTWLDSEPSEDCHARALIGLAAVMAEMPGTEPGDRARQLFVRALPAAVTFGALRSISGAILACDSACEAGLSAEVMPAFELLSERLSKAFDDGAVESLPAPRRSSIGLRGGPVPGQRPADAAVRVEWPWPEPLLTYENALMPHALIAAGKRLGRPGPLARGRAVLDWLIEIQAGEEGCFSPVGNSNWWPRTGERSRFDQQPIEAAAMVSAAAAALRATGDRRYLAAAETAYGWFLGDNDLGVALADPVRGACHDALTPRGVNLNQGAESTLMWLTALEQMREIRHRVQAESRPGLGAESSIERSVRP